MMASHSKVIYIGMTNDLKRRVWEHKNKIHPDSFTSKYNCTKLVWFDETNDVKSAIAYEKKIKGWLRKRKLDLINTKNPTWLDLSELWE